MKKFTKLSLCLLAIIIALSIMSASVVGSPDQYELIWWTIDCGGGDSQSDGGQFSLTSTIGQPDAGETMSGGSYNMGGGIFGDTIPEFSLFPIYIPLVDVD